jgi:hypothetical protein
MSLDLNSKESVIDWIMGSQDVTKGLVHCGKLLALFSKALEQDGCHVEFSTLTDIFIDPINEYEERTGNSAGDPDRHLIYPTMVYLHYADWEEAIAKLLGVNVDADIQPDWKAQHPHAGAAMKALSAIGLRVMLSGSKAYEAQHGHSMFEVFMASCETGEDFDQSRARLTAKRKGLRMT